MKGLLKVFVGVLVFSMLFASCKKDKDVTTKNYFKIGETEYTLSVGCFENYGEDEGMLDDLYYDGYNIDLTLCSSGINIGGTDEADFSGTGQMLYFEMFTSTSTNLDARNYTFDETSDTYPVGTFYYGDYILNWNEQENYSEVEISSGSVTVAKNGDEYEITINCIDEDGKTITGFYKGTLQYFDYEETLKSSKKKHRR